MAEESPIQNLCDETMCPICLEYFKDPVIIDCGHIFCQACIIQCWGGPDKDALCPQCREPCQQRSFRPNRQLASIVAIAKKFSLQMAKGAEALGRVCERHQEPLKLFCEDDQALICVVCDKSKEHREHKVIPKEEAFEEYKGKILSHLEFLKKEKEKSISSILSGETESKKLLEQTEKERQKIVAEFEQLRQFLEQQENLLLAKVKNLDDKIKGINNKHIAKLSDEISSIDKLIKEMEEKQKQPANEFLQDIRGILQRCDEKKCVDQIAFPPALMEQIEKFSKTHPFLETVMKDFKAKLTGTENMTIPTVGVAMDSQARTQFMNQYASLNVIYGRPPFPQLYCWTYVMGTERITSGSHSLVVNVGRERFWAVGVAKESIRSGSTSNSKHGIWALGRFPDGKLSVFTSPQISLGSCPSSVSQSLFGLQVMPERVCVSLNYEGGTVAFSDADKNTPIYTFFQVLFSGEGICSWFSVGE